jgi:putative transposase
VSLFRSLLLVIAGSTQRELARQVRYLKVGNEILRNKLPARITITPKERQRLVKFGAKLGRVLHELVTIVTPGTFLRWIRDEKRMGWRRIKPTQRGRSRTAEEIRRLIVKLAKENAWGYARIVGELKKLGFRSIKKSTVRNILKAEGLDPCPKRNGATWDEFVARHAVSLWQADFFTEKVLTVKGPREAFVLAFLNVKTRRVVLSPATFHPDATWVKSQSECFVKQARADGLRVRYVQRDRDGKFGTAFDVTLRKLWIEAVTSPPQAPNTQAFVERFIGSIRRECLTISSSSVPCISITSLDPGSNITTTSGRIKDARMNCSSGRCEPRIPKPSTRPLFRFATSVVVSGSADCSSITSESPPNVVAPICNADFLLTHRVLADCRKWAVYHYRRSRFSSWITVTAPIRNPSAPSFRRALFFCT